ncbi:hypothetical protein [Stackebrandtia nassauensis]|uniref:Uncharacterized protein n=1 Tax=Stackebrandtia nassauensis (strain DSM 44728 / CIP 108903 / NRRL B-16338 / NBRC 102104 / LLR-40K-21) TaxID=446470 RepID=D3Q193_STANL|nr:hypothetical protein [Stackebrandtia nassauensis]ADD45673.1 hypothetical protein Snas_6049 [Stackebrandtia nassauensis DSM 44728]
MTEVVVNRETMRRFYRWCQTEAANLTGWREDACLPEQDMTPDANTGRVHAGMPVPIPDGPGVGEAGGRFATQLVDSAVQHRAILEGLNALGAIAEQALSEMDNTDVISAERLGEITRDYLPEGWLPWAN